MKAKSSARPDNTYIVTLPIDPLGADDPTIMEGFPEHARLIGYILAEWSQVEFKIVGLTAIALKLRFPTMAAMVYSLESSGARLKMVGGVLAHLKAEPAISEAETLLNDAESLRNQRNKYAHGLYGHGPNGDLVIYNVRTGALTEIPLHDLIHQYDRMKALSYRAGRLLATIAGIFAMQPQSHDASAAQPTAESGSADPPSSSSIT